METTAIKARLFSSILHSIELLIFFIIITTNLYILLHQWPSSHYLLPVLFALFLPALRWLYSRSDCYLVDFACLRPTTACRVPTSAFLEHIASMDCFDEASKVFMTKVMTSSGLGQETYLPSPLHYIPPIPDHDDAVREAEMLLFPTLDNLLSKTNLSPGDIDILVLNCSGFCPEPSLTSLLIHRYKMREDVLSFNLSGMGCSAGAIGVDVAKGLLSTGRGSYAVVMSTEILSIGWYPGNDCRKLRLNCLFRMGASAVLLTNKRSSRCKYKLKHLIRTQRAFDDRAYLSAIREEDPEGITGFSIERDLLSVAAETLRGGVVATAPLVLPLHEKARYALACAKRAAFGGEKAAPLPNFRTAARHFCLPGSGRAVMEQIGRGLRLGRQETEAAEATFHRFGNQSSASIWYQLSYSEAKGRVRKGDRVWQLAMGSGPKSNSMVWECIRDIEEQEEEQIGPWGDYIYRYPITAGGGSIRN